MGKINWKEWGMDILVDLFAGMIIAIGIYNFALNANFPVAGFSGIAIIMYHLIGLPVGAGTILLMFRWQFSAISSWEGHFYQSVSPWLSHPS